MPTYKFTLEDIRYAAERRNLVWTSHSFKRLRERHLRRAEVIEVLRHGEILERNLFDVPHPSCKMSLTTKENKTFQVAVAYDSSFQEAHILTIYRRR